MKSTGSLKSHVAPDREVVPEMGTMPAHWGVYLTVTDADETSRLAVELGATRRPVLRHHLTAGSDVLCDQVFALKIALFPTSTCWSVGYGRECDDL